MKQENLRLRVGLFVAIGLFVIVVVILKFGRLTERMQNTYEIKAYFDSVSNISPGAPVRMSGVRIGRAESIELQRIDTGELKVRVGLRINQANNIASDTQLFLVSSGMLGESYFQFVAPLRRASGPPIEFYPKDNEATIPDGKTKPGIEDATEGISLAARRLNEIFGDEAFRKNILLIPQNATELTHRGSQAFIEIESFAKQLNTIMQRINQGEGTVGKLVNDDALYNKATDAIDEVTKTASAFRQRPLSQIWSYGAQPKKDDVWETLFGKKESIKVFNHRATSRLPDTIAKPESRISPSPPPDMEKMEEVVERAVQEGVKKGVEAAIKETSTESSSTDSVDTAPIEEESSNKD